MDEWAAKQDDKTPRSEAIRRLVERAEKQKMSELDPTPELPDETPIAKIRFPARIRNVFFAEGLQTVGQVRETSDAALLSFPDLGPGSVAHVRKTLGLPSKEGVRPDSIKLKANGK